MRKRAGEGLLHLDRDRCIGLVGQAMILPFSKGELGLQEEVAACYQALGNGRGDAPPDSGLIIMPALIGGIDAAKALVQRQLGQPLGFLFLPGGAIEEARNLQAVD